MENCLVTRLKSVVDNDNLPVLGSIIVGVKVNAGNIIQNSVRTDNPNSPVLIKILDDGVTITSVSGGAVLVNSKEAYVANFGDALTISGASENDSVKVQVTSKYDIVMLQNLRGCTINLDEFKYCTKMTTFEVGNISGANLKAYGDISEFADLTTLQVIGCAWDDVTGEIESLGKLTNLNTINFGVNNTPNRVEGSLSDFVIAQRANGRTTCDGIEVRSADYCYFSFGNVQRPRFYDPNAYPATLSWTADKIDYVMDRGIKHFAFLIGYTQQEINAMTASGGKYEGFTVTKCD